MLLTFIDYSALGRLDYATMSQQALMECFIAQLPESSSDRFDITIGTFQDENGNFTDIEYWECLKFDADGNVIEIVLNTSGKLFLEWLPPSVRRIQLGGRGHDIYVDFSRLPQSLQSLYFGTLTIIGEICLDELPKQIEHLFLDTCEFSGKVGLSAIPATLLSICLRGHSLESVDLQSDSSLLTFFEASSGKLYGEVSFLKSPPSLQFFDLHENALNGTLCFEGLSQSLETLNLAENSLKGTLRFDGLPKTLRTLDLHLNSFKEISFETALPQNLRRLKIDSEKCADGGKGGVVDFHHISASVREVYIKNNQLRGSVEIAHIENLRALCAEYNALDGSIDFAVLPQRLQRLELNNNKLNGSIDLTALPQNMQKIYLSSNMFSGTIDLLKLPARMQRLDLSKNQLRGSFTLAAFSADFEAINLTGNRFEMDALVVPTDVRSLPKISLDRESVMRIVNEEGGTSHVAQIEFFERIKPAARR